MNKLFNWFWVVAGIGGIVYSLPRLGQSDTLAEGLINIFILGAIVVYNYPKTQQIDKLKLK